MVRYTMSVELKTSCKVWSRFQVTRKDGSVVKLRIQDLEWDKHKEDVMDFVMKYFIKDEAFHKAAGISSGQAILECKEILFLLYEKQKPQFSVCYIDEDSHTNDIIGLSIISDKKFQSDEDNLKDFKPKTKEVQNLFNILNVIQDMKASNGYDSFYEGRGICVRPDYRGLGIANEFVRLRIQICIDNNVQMTCAWMTSVGTQKAADRYNWKTFLDLPVEQLEKQTGLIFEDSVPTFKLMYITKD